MLCGKEVLMFEGVGRPNAPRWVMQACPEMSKERAGRRRQHQLGSGHEKDACTRGILWQVHPSHVQMTCMPAPHPESEGSACSKEGRAHTFSRAG